MRGRTRSRARGRAAALLVALLASAGALDGRQSDDVESADDLLIVDCLLPPKVRRLGRRSTFLAPRQPVRTTALECRIRGGEYTEPDQANLGTALKVWLPQAEAGDVEAQYYVGQMFEKGLGVPPDFGAAAEWYRRAAEQGYAPAQINLGSLYETGRGVELDPEAALVWYRRAAGLAEDLVVLQGGEYDALTGELEETEEALERATGELEEARRESEELTRELEELEGRVEELEEEAEAGPERAAVSFGSFYALVIGNGEYAALPPLATAVPDARWVAETLERDYGFEVERLENATRLEIMRALNALRERLTEEDNLLVYYAGHAGRDERGTAAYWQPSDAEPDSPANWIPSELVSEHLDLVPARHVMVVSDALFSGLRTRSAIASLPAGMTEEERHYHLRLLREKRCRLVLASGSVRPVSPAPEAEHSVFADAFVSSLAENPGVLESTALYRRVARRMSGASAPAVPELAAMQWARNDVSEFFFVRQSS